MKISFVMPVHDKEPYISDAIDSVLHQSHKDFELIIVDDASKDGSFDISQHYFKNSKKIKLIHSTVNVGVASARNIGWAEATGEIVCPMDADDLSAIHRARITSKFFEDNPKIDIMYGSCGAIDQNNNFIEGRQARKLSIYEMKNQNYIQHITVAYKRKLGVKYREGLKFIDDWYFYMDCIEKGLKFGFVKDLLGMFRTVPDGLSFGGGFDSKPKLKLKEKLRKEFANLEEDLTEQMRSPLQAYRLKEISSRIPKGSSVLDVGCNTGYLLDMLKKRCKVAGVEVARNLIKILNAKGYKVYGKDNGIKGKFDRIIMGDILEHFDNKTADKMVDKYYKLLARGGKIIITTPHRLGPYREEFLKEHKRDVDVKDFDKYDADSWALFYGNYAIPIWNMMEISK